MIHIKLSAKKGLTHSFSGVKSESSIQNNQKLKFIREELILITWLAQLKSHI